MALPPFATAADTRRIHVSSSIGSDGLGDGSAGNPYKTLAKGYSMLRSGYPDWLLLLWGDTWVAGGGEVGYFPNWGKSGRSNDLRMVVTSYGTGAPPQINSGNHYALGVDLFVPQQSHLIFSDMHFYGNGYTTVDDVAGIAWTGHSQNVSFEYITSENYLVCAKVQSIPVSQRNTNIVFDHCVLLDAYSTVGMNAEGLYVSETDGLTINNCIFDRCGWRLDVPGSVPTIFRHPVYVQNGCTNVAYVNNAISRTDGAQIRPGGVMRENLACQSINGLHVGVGDTPEANGIYAYMTRNVTVDGVPLAAGQVVLGFRASNLIGGYARDNLVARATDMTDARGFWYSTINGYPTLRIAQNFSQLRNRYYEAGPITMEGADTQYGGVSIDSCVVQSETLPPIANNRLVVASNANTLSRFTCHSSPNKWHSTANPKFSANSVDHDITYWNQQTSGTDIVAAESFLDVTRSPATYMGTIGSPANYAAYYAAIRAQTRATWDTRLDPINVNSYIRRGFNM